MTGKIDTKQNYEVRQVVAKMGLAGKFREGGKQYKIFQFLTFWSGGGPSFAAEFVRPATNVGGFLFLEDLKVGEIVVKPGLIYRKIPMTGMIMAEHMRAMKKFKPKRQIVYERDTAPAVDVGSINLTEGGK